MKKVLFFLGIIALMATANAQLTATHEGEALANGATIPISTNSSGDESGEDAIFDFTLTNSGDTVGSWDVDGERVDGSMLNVSAICCGVLCRPGTHNSANLAAGASTLVSIHLSVPSNTPNGTSENFKIKISNQATGNEEFSFFITLTYTGSSASITSATVAATGNAFPNPASNSVTINYSVDGAAQFVLTDITGRQVMEQAVNGNGQLTLNVENLSRGVYLYGIRQSNKQQPMKKLIVR